MSRCPLHTIGRVRVAYPFCAARCPLPNFRRPCPGATCAPAPRPVSEREPPSVDAASEIARGLAGADLRLSVSPAEMDFPEFDRSPIPMPAPRAVGAQWRVL